MSDRCADRDGRAVPSIVLTEQNLDFVLARIDRLYILEKGEVKFAGGPDDVRRNNEILQKHLMI